MSGEDALRARIAELEGELDRWRTHVAALERGETPEAPGSLRARFGVSELWSQPLVLLAFSVATLALVLVLMQWIEGAAPPPRVHWLGRVTDARASDLAPGAVCELSALLSGASPAISASRPRIVCDGHVVFEATSDRGTRCTVERALTGRPGAVKYVIDACKPLRGTAWDGKPASVALSTQHAVSVERNGSLLGVGFDANSEGVVGEAIVKP